jgi:hypothetical protein
MCKAVDQNSNVHHNIHTVCMEWSLWMQKTGSKELRRSRLSLGCKTIQRMECKQPRLKDINSYIHILWLCQLSVLQESFHHFHLNARDVVFLFLPLCKYFFFPNNCIPHETTQLWNTELLPTPQPLSLSHQTVFFFNNNKSLRDSNFLAVNHF